MTHTPPVEAIDDSPAVCVHINKQWVSYVMGLLEPLVKTWFWSGDDETVYDAQQEGEKLMLALALGSEVCMVPIGTILLWPGTGVPENYLLCDGGLYLPSAYPALYDVIGTSYGSLGGNFQVPNLTGRFPLGVSGSHALASSGGAETVTLTTAQLPAHSHSILTRSNAPTGGNARLAQAGGSASDNSNQSTEQTGTGTAHENMPPYLTLNHIIRAK